MTTVAELDRVQNLVNRLTALSGAQRGDVIRAQQWNDLVGIMIALTQAFLTSRPDDSVPPHEHPDQVKPSWLDPSLRSLIEKGPLADPEATARYVDVDRRVRSLLTDLEGIRGAASAVRDRVAEISTRELVRDANITEVGRVVNALDERKDAVTELRRTLDSIHGKLNQAIEVGSRLIVDGAPVDMSSIDLRIKAVEELRNRLKLSSGESFDAHTFETKIADLRNSVITQAQLDEALKRRAAEIPEETINDLRTSVTTAIRTELNATIADTRSEIDARTDARLAAVDATVAQRIDDRLPTAINAALNSIRTEIATTAEDVRKEARTASERSSAAAIDALRQELKQSLDSIQAGLPGLVSTAVDKTLPARIADIQATVAGARTDAAAALTKANAQAADLQATKARVEQVNLQIDAAVKKSRDEITAEIKNRDVSSKQDLDRRLGELEVRIDTKIDDRIKGRLNLFQSELTTSMQQTAAEAAAAAVRSAIVPLRADMTTIARDQAAAIQDQVRSSVLADLDVKINNSVVNEVKRAKLTPVVITRP